MNKISLGNRMKEYESVPKNYLIRRTPVIIRLDGVGFHTFTRGFKKPFDKTIEVAMKDTMLRLCRNIQGCVLGYTQSDEITLVLCDYQKIDTDAWFGYGVEKICSIAASMATLFFNKSLNDYKEMLKDFDSILFADVISLIEEKIEKGALFDARCFNLPKEEVTNCLIWRQQDATRNSIQALAQSMFSHKELQGLNCNKLQDKIFLEKGINWNDLSTYRKRGICAIKEIKEKEIRKNGEIKKVMRKEWVIDRDTPIFTQNREYINSRIIFEEG